MSKPWIVDNINKLSSEQKDHLSEENESAHKAKNIQMENGKSVEETVGDGDYSAPETTFDSVTHLDENATNGQISVGLNGLTATNLVKNGNFTDGTSGWRTYSRANLSFDNEILKISANGESRFVPTYNINSAVEGKNHKFYTAFTVRSTSDKVSSYSIHFRTGGGFGTGFETSGTFSTSSGWKTISYVNENTTESLLNTYCYTVYIDGEEIEGEVCEMKEPIFINLTETFGAGNEPTKEECDRIFPSYLNGTKSTISGRVKSVGKNLFDGNFHSFLGIASNGSTFSAGSTHTTERIRVKPGDKIYRSSHFSDRRWIVLSRSGDIIKVDNKKPAEMPDGAYYFQTAFRAGDEDDLIIHIGTTSTSYEPYTSTSRYYPPIPLRSLPNGVKDEISDDGKLIKRVGFETIDHTLDWGVSGTQVGEDGWKVFASDYFNNLNHSLSYGKITDKNNEFEYELATEEGHEFIEVGTYGTSSLSAGTFQINIPKEFIGETEPSTSDIQQYFEDNPHVLIYQLAEPEITDISGLGELQSHPNGTIYQENATRLVKSYDDGITTDLPIDYIESVTKLDDAQRIPIDLDDASYEDSTEESMVDGYMKSDVSISGAEDGEIYEIVYFFKSEISTAGEMEYSYPINLAGALQSTSKVAFKTAEELSREMARQRAVNLEFDFRINILED